MFATDQAIPPHELAIEAESRGFESLWFPEHGHIPPAPAQSGVAAPVKRLDRPGAGVSESL